MGRNTPYVAYFRVSTQQQGQSGLGLEAQRESVRRFLVSQHAGSDQPVAQYTEIESGKRSKVPASATRCIGGVQAPQGHVSNCEVGPPSPQRVLHLGIDGGRNRVRRG